MTLFADAEVGEAGDPDVLAGLRRQLLAQLLDQQHVNAEKHDSKTIEQLRQELAAKTGENIRIARFSYFRVGE